MPAIVDEATFALAARRLVDNKRFATRNSTSPSLLRGLVACQACSYAYYRTSTRTTKRKISYYRCIGSDGWRHEGGKVCDNRPVRADQLEPLVWEHVTRLLTDPTLIAGELERRLAQLRAANPATAQRGRLERDLTRARAGIARLLEAYQEQLLTLASQLPAAVLADLLNLSTGTAVGWVHNAGGDWSRYAASLAQEGDHRPHE